jgi:hypothetical protein
MVKQKYPLASKRLKYLVLFLSSIAPVVGMMLWCLFSGGYYSSLAITYGKNDYPLITTDLQGNPCILAVGIGARFPLSLRQETLDGIVDKKAQGTTTVHNIKGEKQEVPSYLIPKLKIGDLILKNVVAHQSEADDYGTLGKFLGREFNLLLDFPHSRIIVCDTFSKLQTKEVVGSHWIRVPFEMHCGGAVFHVDTDFGTRKLAINTTCTLTHLHSSFIPPGKSSVSSSFVLGGQQFGSVTFQSINLPEGLNEIDGFIGMDFFKKHAMYLDYTHKVAHIEPPEGYFERIPVTFTGRGDPIIDVSIEGNAYPLALDLGSSFPCSLRHEILQNIHKTKYGTAWWSDFKGQRYESPAYTIPELKINDLVFADMLIRQSREDFYTNVTLKGSPFQPFGIIGLPILEKYNLFLDFPHSTIYASRDRLSLQEAGLLSENLLAIPFIHCSDGLLLSIETDTGTHRLALDTGSTHTLMRAPHPTFTKKFCIMGHDFGGCSIITIDENSQFDFDGFLGMDFLREYSLFIDYSNKLIFIDLQKESSQTSIPNVIQE